MKRLSKYSIVILALAAELAIIYAFSSPPDVSLQMTAIQPQAGGDADIATHKALYDFRLVSAEAGAGISDVTGRMYFEQDDACDAWTTEHRLTTEYHYDERQGISNTSRYVAFEAKDQARFSFNSEREEEGETVERLRGSIEIGADGAARAIYSKPDDLKYDLPQGYFLPTHHTMETIRHARAGDHFFSAAVFDGTDAEGPVMIGAFIGKKATPEELKKIAAANKDIDASLLTPEAWHVRMAVFPIKDKEESVPAYEMEMVLHDNGVISYALVDYKTFKVEQNLAALEKLPRKKCD